jgi:general secretion pathway protein A
MFLEFYGLREQPFGVTPDPRFMYLSPAHREALASLYYGIESGRGFLGLIAKPGMGKTTLLFHLLEKFRHSARTAFLFQTQCSSREFMRFLLAELGVESRDNDFPRMHEEFNKMLLQEAQAGRRFIVVVDEAQNLDATVMETVRLLSDFETPRAKLLQIILSGQPELADKLASRNMAQLRQRVSLLNRLTPLSIDETRKYIMHRMNVAGHSGPLPFTAEALVDIARFTEGIPRNINNFCFNVLSLGCALHQRVVDPMMVEEVIRDLDIRQHMTEVAPDPASDREPLHVATSKDFPAAYDATWAAGSAAHDTLTPAEAKAYMRQFAVQLKDWKRN